MPQKSAQGFQKLVVGTLRGVTPPQIDHANGNTDRLVNKSSILH